MEYVRYIILKKVRTSWYTRYLLVHIIELFEEKIEAKNTSKNSNNGRNNLRL